MPVEVSVTIVAYNNYEEVMNAIMSIEKWTDANLSKKIYIVDNGAGLCCAERIEEF